MCVCCDFALLSSVVVHFLGECHFSSYQSLSLTLNAFEENKTKQVSICKAHGIDWKFLHDGIWETENP